MHPFPSADEIGFLVGAEMNQIFIDPYEVRFRLVKNRVFMEVRSGGAFTYRNGGIEDTFEPSRGCHGQGSVRFHALLNQTVSTMTISPAQDELTLAFAEGPLLTIYSELGGFESGTISSDGPGGGLWIF